MDRDEANDLLFEAACTGETTTVRRLVAAGINVNTKDNYGCGRTALHNAALNGQNDVIQLLLASGAKVDVKADLDGKTALDYATLARHVEAAKLLKEAAKEQQGHAGRVTGERKDKGPPQVGG